MFPMLIILPDLITRTVWELPMEAESRRSGSLIAVGRVATCWKGAEREGERERGGRNDQGSSIIIYLP